MRYWDVAKRQLKRRRSLFLFIGYVVYIIIGALIFKQVEHQEENQKCEIAKMELIKETHRFGNEYIFDLGLNLKYCGGIPRVAAANKQSPVFDPELVEIFEEWYDSGCTFSAFNHLTQELSLVGPRVAPQLSAFYKSIMALGDMKPKFDDEIFTISGRTVRKILKQSAQFGIHHYQKLNEACETRWDFESAFFFSGTVATTIGYGNIAPSTRTGKLFTLVFSLIGIPYFGILTRVLSEDIKRGVNNIKEQIRRQFDVCPKYIAQWIYIGFGVVSLILIPSIIFRYFESWSLFDAVYFSLMIG